MDSLKKGLEVLGGDGNILSALAKAKVLEPSSSPLIRFLGASPFDDKS